MKHDTYKQNGIAFSKKTFVAGSQVDLFYDGLLKTDGAKQVSLHIGYGDLWDGATYIPMKWMNELFCATIELGSAGLMQLAFVDNAGNWDNNSGDNYRFRVTNTRKAKAVPAVNTDDKGTLKPTKRAAMK